MHWHLNQYQSEQQVKFLPKKLCDNEKESKETFQCSYCNSNYTRKASLNTHLKQKHQENEPISWEAPISSSTEANREILEKKCLIGDLYQNGLKNLQNIMKRTNFAKKFRWFLPYKIVFESLNYKLYHCYICNIILQQNLQRKWIFDMCLFISSRESNQYVWNSKLHFVESLVILCYKCSNGIICNISSRWVG